MPSFFIERPIFAWVIAILITLGGVIAISQLGEAPATPGAIGAIAVPIRADKRVVACINILYLMQAIGTEQVVARHLPELQETARRIELGYRSVLEDAS